MRRPCHMRRRRPSPAPPPPCWYTSRHTWPSLLSLSAHRVTSDGLSPLQPHVPLPPIPPRPPRDQQGNLVLQPGDCCLLILQCLCIKWWGGGFVRVSVCVRDLSLSLMHACTGGCGRTLRDAGLRTLSSTQETPALGRVNGQCTTTGSVIFIE